MIHPARQMRYDELADGLLEEVSVGTVNMQIEKETGLVLFCYSKSCVYERAWNKFSEMARGLILDMENDLVVATPFPKFFNVSERGETIPDLPFEIFEKLDGSLIILFWHDGKWRTATKGSFKSEQAKWAQEYIATQDLNELPRGTYLFEAIYPENRIVLRYDYTGLVLLAAYAEDGMEWPYHALCRISEYQSWPVARRVPFSSVSELLINAKTLPANEEGWVLRFDNGLRLKIKGDEYLRLHRAISRLTPLAVWEAMLAGDDLITFRKELPEEFWPDFDSMFSILDRQARKILADTKDELEKISCGQKLTDKEVGLKLDQVPQRLRGFIFPYRKHGANALLDVRTRTALYRAIRPTGNRLDGYTPSGAVVRVFEEAA